MADYTQLLNVGQGAYGSVPIGPSAVSTAGSVVPQAITLGQQAYAGLPGYQQSLNNIGNYISSTTAGQLPDDVVRQIGQRAAERGVAMGAPGSPNVGASYLRDIGLNSLQLQGIGQNAFQSILPTLPGASLSQNAGLYVNPNLQYEADLQKAIFEAAPNPTMAAGAAMGAARSGYGTGLGAISPIAYGGFGYGTPSSEDFMAQPWEVPNHPAVGAYGYGTGGTFIGGQYYEPGQSPLSQDRVNSILQNYGPNQMTSESDGGNYYGGDNTLDPFGQDSYGGEFDPFEDFYGGY